MSAPLRSRVLESALSSRTLGAARGVRRFVRTLARKPRMLRYYHRVDDPRSWLMARMLGPLVDAYGLSLEVETVPDPAAEVDPEPQLRARFDVEDTRRLAAHFGLAFPEPGVETVAARVRMANALALHDRPPREKLDLLAHLSELLLSRQGDALADLADSQGVLSGAEVRPSLEAAYARLRSHGHYASAVVEYEGETYAGVERLHHLERRLVAEGLTDHALAPRLRMPPAEPGASLVDVEVFFSYRSPYSYLAVEQLASLATSHSLRLVLRPVLPMVMRGLAVPRDKRLYIVRDAKREAELHDIAFGRIVDPVGAGVERCLAVHLLAKAHDRELDYARAALGAIWSRGVDMVTDEGLLEVAATVGLGAGEVRAALVDESFRAVAERNREAMYDAGFWGVPTFRVGAFATWGQDRIPLVLEAASAARRAAR